VSAQGPVVVVGEKLSAFPFGQEEEEVGEPSKTLGGKKNGEFLIFRI
jgi:hypothetical protein